MTARTASPLRVGLIGYGLAGEAFHAPLIAATPALELDVIVTSDPTRQRAARNRHPGAEVVSSADELWQRAAGLDVAVIATPNRTHVPLALAALEAGLHVVVDKPMARTAAECRLLIDAARARGRALTVFQNRRWDGDFLTLRQLLADGALGEPLRFESRFERWRTMPKPGWRERAAPDEAGGILYDLGSHLIDQALVLFGPVAGVYAEIERRRPQAEVDDDVFLALRHESGVISHLYMSAVAALPAPRMRLLGSRAAYVKRGMDVQEAALRGGARADTAQWGVEPESAWGELGAGENVQRVPTQPGAYPRFYELLADSLRTGTSPPVDAADAAAVVDVIERALRSAIA